MSSGRRTAPPVTAAWLEAAAARYLARFEASSARLRRVLLAKVLRSAKDHGTDPEEGRRLVEALIARTVASGLVDDDRFAKSKAASLRRKGASARGVRDRLAVDGIDRDTVSGALAAADESDPASAEQAAALAYARRRRLGPFRPPEARAAFKDKDTAALMRAGYSWEVVRAVLAMVDGAAEG